MNGWEHLAPVSYGQDETWPTDHLAQGGENVDLDDDPCRVHGIRRCTICLPEPTYTIDEMWGSLAPAFHAAVAGDDVLRDTPEVRALLDRADALARRLEEGDDIPG